MFTESTRSAMMALAAIDVRATEEERTALAAVLSGRQEAEERTRNCRIVKYAEAAKRLGVSVQSVKRMAGKGVLRRVTTGGIRACGVTEDSLMRALAV